MSFNIRYGTANDGENHWTNRRDMLFALLRTENPDLIGLQEALRFQIDEILAAVPGYAVVGVGRDDGRAAGEMSAILFRTARFHVAASGTFWFSDTPEIPGSKTWGNRITRIASWARFVDRDGTAFSHYNLHLDHESQPSREKSTALLLQRITARPVPRSRSSSPATSTPASRTPCTSWSARLARRGRRRCRPPRCGAAAVHRYLPRGASRREGGRALFTNFVFGQTSGEKIDYVLVQPGTEVLAAAIVRTGEGRRYPVGSLPGHGADPPGRRRLADHRVILTPCNPGSQNYTPVGSTTLRARPPGRSAPRGTVPHDPAPWNGCCWSSAGPSDGAMRCAA